MSSSPSLDSEFVLVNKNDLLSVSWNANYQSFIAGTTQGFRIYDCDPFKETSRYLQSLGAFRIVEMLDSNTLVFVGDGTNPNYPPNRVMIYEHSGHRVRIIKFGHKFKSDIRALKLRQNQMVVVLDDEISVFNFINLKLLHEIKTLENPRGLCCLSHSSDTFVLACPGLKQGQVLVEHFGQRTVIRPIEAHNSHVACLTLSMDGQILATASTKGTLIRIFNTADGTKLQEVRRGLDQAYIYGIALSASVEWLVVSSDKGTIHVFSLALGSNQLASGQCAGLAHQNSSNTGANPSSSLALMKGLLPKYLTSESSLAKFYLTKGTEYIAAFGAQNTVMIVGMDGSFYRCKFDPVNGGEMQQQEYVRFLTD